MSEPMMSYIGFNDTSRCFWPVHYQYWENTAKQVRTHPCQGIGYARYYHSCGYQLHAVASTCHLPPACWKDDLPICDGKMLHSLWTLLLLSLHADSVQTPFLLDTPLGLLLFFRASGKLSMS